MIKSVKLIDGSWMPVGGSLPNGVIDRLEVVWSEPVSIGVFGSAGMLAQIPMSSVLYFLVGNSDEV